MNRTDESLDNDGVLAQVSFGLAISDAIIEEINARAVANRHWWQSLDDKWRRLMWRYGLGREDAPSAEPSDALLDSISAIAVLDLSGCELQDIRPLAHLSYLNALTLNDNSISDLSPLAQLVHLSYLELDNNQIKDIRPLANLRRLMVLSLGFNHISDLPPLTTLTELVRLDLYYNLITDIRPLATLVELEFLYLGYDDDCGKFYAPNDAYKPNHIVDLSPLARLPKLKQLGLTQIGVSDITPVGAIRSLVCLGLSYNPIEDIKVLLKLEHLQVVYLAGVQVDSQTIEDLGGVLTDCYIETCDVAI